ncbi:hypothetical protein [Parageobacillus sp. KH3-4]|uniref:hypothetical protein n=1 Tax=Parageobacillus sp. KH3-4 TaxID=2916802 RepID=UPI001FCC141B|nr:hypothetical protein [Parageobacillus sp. KH3-4]
MTALRPVAFSPVSILSLTESPNSSWRQARSCLYGKKAGMVLPFIFIGLMGIDKL